jgi:ATP/ADP translocase
MLFLRLSVMIGVLFLVFLILFACMFFVLGDLLQVEENRTQTLETRNCRMKDKD